MHTELPLLIYEDLILTRNYLQDIAKVLGSVQRAYIPPEAHDWQHGLEMSMRGIATQPFTIADHDARMILDLVRHKVRIGETNWSLEEYAGPELIKNIKVWLASRGQTPVIEQPEFSGQSRFASEQADKYAQALWWIDARFRSLAGNLNEGVISPILLYPHHFDLSLSWFPDATTDQISMGFSSGDDEIAEPYLYITLFPQHADFSALELPDEAYMQATGFHGAVLPYGALQSSRQPEIVFANFAATFLQARALLVNGA